VSRVPKGDAAGLAVMYAADAQVFPPNSDIVTGAAAIQNLWQGVIDTGKYVVVWKRVGGRWKLLRDIWNTSRPAPAK
jgi:ketosteroid isomerase-like protein